MKKGGVCSPTGKKGGGRLCVVRGTIPGGKKKKNFNLYPRGGEEKGKRKIARKINRLSEGGKKRVQKGEKRERTAV